MLLRSLHLRHKRGEKISNDERALVATICTVGNLFNRQCDFFDKHKAAKDVSDLASFIRAEPPEDDTGREQAGAV